MLVSMDSFRSKNPVIDFLFYPFRCLIAVYAFARIMWFFLTPVGRVFTFKMGDGTSHRIIPGGYGDLPGLLSFAEDNVGGITEFSVADCSDGDSPLED